MDIENVSRLPQKSGHAPMVAMWYFLNQIKIQLKSSAFFMEREILLQLRSAVDV